jgi:hypothetical protein
VNGWLVFFLLAAIVLANGVSIELMRQGLGVSIAREYGVLESAQIALLAVAIGMFGLGWNEANGPERTASGLLTMLAAAMFVRELDVKKFNGPDWYNWLGAHGLQEVLLVGMTLPVLYHLARRRDHWLRLLNMAFMPSAIPLIIAGVLILAGNYIDRRVASFPTKIFWEELVELNGYMFFVVSGYIHLCLVRAGKIRASLEARGAFQQTTTPLQKSPLSLLPDISAPSAVASGRARACGRARS